ncbi:MAG: PAC2 family protein [Thermogemmatispora sp.]|uniref:PAC2 family protein n=1 Tax=Thermogemmatispora sp. TaxID=1968838 RepID=UPI001A05B9F0|nr:PAC2 family protein [Thermogemmatispora sp.]MBE3566525.1 PAC2 family protein [Thermogemmatispora sp.]
MSMSLIQYYREHLQLRNPVLIAALAGWNDAADSATTAIKFLIDRWKPVKIAEIDSEDFYVFTETRPIVRIVDGMQRSLVWPANQFSAHSLPEQERDIILYLGVEPQLKWRTFSECFLEVSTFTSRKSFCWGLCWRTSPTRWPCPSLAARQRPSFRNGYASWISTALVTRAPPA